MPVHKWPLRLIAGGLLVASASALLAVSSGAPGPVRAYAQSKAGKAIAQGAARTRATRPGMTV